MAERRWHFLPLFCLAAALGGWACAPGPGGLDEGQDESVESDAEGVSGSVAVGTKLQATGNVNLRAGASTSSSILDVVPDGDQVTVKQAVPSGGFYLVTYQGATGWTSGKFYEVVAAPDDGGGAGDIRVATVNVNLRQGPGTNFAVLGVVSAGDEVTLQESAQTNGYYHVDYDGIVGWTKASYYSEPGDSGTDPGQPWTCTGSYATTKVAGGKYYATSFGCWVDDNGVAHQDSGDNCIPFCLAQAKSDGLCAGITGPQCERKVNWYAADSGRFGCLTRLRVKSIANGKSAIVAVLDAGPACSVEKKVKAGVLDLSSRVTEYLFGGQVGTGDAAMVQVEEVPANTPLGPE